MGFAIRLDVYDSEDAKRRKRPYEVAWDVNRSTEPQLRTGIMLLEVVLDRLRKAHQERFPDEYPKARYRGSDPGRQSEDGLQMDGGEREGSSGGERRWI